ncbi:tetraspanin-33 [Rhipicephalus sanguineus]|uniref:tetraspanin-33 n=1 Tax=Rhipicephalus sanguineus TaxID=34632 RepID=UPI001895E371|nr:tetraspanin-33 [Rhipicephalus sanguineus]
MKRIPTPKGDEPTLIIDVSPWHRVPLVFINLFLFSFSCMVAFICVTSIYDRRDEISFANRSLLISFVVNLEVSVLFISGLVLVISFMGFVGALRENIRFLAWYIKGICLLTVITVIFIFGALIMPFLSKNSAQSLFSIDLIVSYRDNPDYARLVDYAQASFSCCGITTERYHDWGHNIYFNCSPSNPSTERCSVPASCCRPLEGENPDLETRLKRRFCGSGVLAMTEQEAWQTIYTRSCVDACVAFMRANSLITIGVGFVAFSVLNVLRGMANTVHDEVVSLTRLYDKYYRRVAQGARKSLAQREAMEQVRAARDHLIKRHAKPGRKYSVSRMTRKASWRPPPAYDHMFGRRDSRYFGAPPRPKPSA